MRLQKGPKLLMSLNKDDLLSSKKDLTSHDVNVSQTINLNENVEIPHRRENTSVSGSISNIFSMKRHESEVKLQKVFIDIKNSIKANEMLSMNETKKRELETPDLKTKIAQKRSSEVRNSYCMRGEVVMKMSNVDEFNQNVLNHKNTGVYKHMS